MQKVEKINFDFLENPLNSYISFSIVNDSADCEISISDVTNEEDAGLFGKLLFILHRGYMNTLTLETLQKMYLKGGIEEKKYISLAINAWKQEEKHLLNEPIIKPSVALKS